MGDFFERIVDLDVRAKDAQALGERTIEWMVSRGYLTREMSGERMYSLNVDEGYLPGPDWAEIVLSRGDEIPGPVAVIVGREDHIGGQGETEPESAVCPRCRTKTVIIDYPERWEADAEAWRPFAEAIGVWKRTGSASASCQACGASVPITEWEWPSGFALGTLALDFWSWPPLSDGFVVEIQRLWGHRIEHHMGKF
ncbi:hypothetical protein [Nocardia donostiensis]|uniref:Uncharacterized protein n=1 Tax=Nocardia donostiensis TaxID=1538463 RepID=A0A1V2TF45_9NOCA|nr:hypothetical protein [Nocardia donostiensis]ONM48140.1 hypothetical protein B0T46_14175 [Nocardia donostiensis]OQS20369.1 hypothetical protein B0T44_10830 [Nocardia donostiensis]